MKHTTASPLLLLLMLFVSNVHATTYYWVKNSSASWNTSSSWSLTSAGVPLLTANPGAGDVVIFDNGGSGACSMVANVTVVACSLRVNFAGSLSLGTTSFITTSSMVVAGGSFNQVSGAQTHQGTFTQTGGSCTFAVNSIVLFIGDFLRTGGGFSASTSTEFRGNVNTGPGGTFLCNTGTVKFTGVNQSITSASTFCIVNINPITNTTLTISGNVNSFGGLYLQGTGAIIINGGTITSTGGLSLSNTSTAGGGNATIIASGAGTFNLSGASAIGQCRLPNLTIAKSGGTFNVSNYLTVTGNFLYDPPGTTGCLSTFAVGSVLAMSGNATLTTEDATVTMYSNMQLGDLTLMTGCYIQLGSYTEVRNILFQPLSQLDVTASNYWLSVGGNWTNQSTSASSFTERAGQVMMRSCTFTSSVTGGESFYDLRLEDPVFVSFTQNSRINIINHMREVGSMGWNIIYNSAAAPLVFLDNAMLDFGNPNSITLAVTGPVIKIGNDPFTFPVGAQVGPMIFPRPITMSAPAQPGDQFTAQYYAANSNSLYSHASRDVSILSLSDCEYWILNRTAGFSSVYVTLNWWLTATPQCDILSPADVVVCHWDGTTWRNDGQSSNVWYPSSTGSFVSAAPIFLNSLTPLTLGSNTIANPLPIELISFSAEPEDHHVNLSWQTATETNNDYFTIERSRDGSALESIDTIDGAGNSTNVLHYSVTDRMPYNNVSYYRLKQVDFNGHFSYSDWKMVQMETPSTIKVYPNPSSGNVSIDLTGEIDALWTMTIMDLSGKVVAAQSGTATDFQSVDLLLPAGSYVLKMLSGEVNYSQPLIITD
jgi:hypothetical protein